MVTQLAAIIADLERAVERTVTAISLDVHANLVASPREGGTPVDTGWASANWIPQVGRPSQFGARPDGAPASARSRAEAGVADVLGYRLGQGAVFITNNVPYLPFLDAGSSPQADAGFVQRAVDKALTTDRLARGASGAGGGGTVTQRIGGGA